MFDSSQRAMKNDWISDRITHPYRVYWLIRRRPISPSFWIWSSLGTTTVSNCKMMDALM